MKYIVEVGTTDGYTFDGTETYEFLDEKEKAIDKYTSIILNIYQYKAMYEEENGKKTTTKYEIHKIPRLGSYIKKITYFVSYVFVTPTGTTGYANGCFDIEGTLAGTDDIRKLEVMCGAQSHAQCTVLYFKKITE